jgi:hypothetical protein
MWGGNEERKTPNEITFKSFNFWHPILLSPCENTKYKYKYIDWVYPKFYCR